jgi:MFS superfamily sulfate permease-like transporter
MGLTLLSGMLMLIMGFFRLGFIANLLGRPVINGLITAAGLMIALGQLKHILGIPLVGHNLPADIYDLVQNPCIEHLILMASGINHIDSSAVESLLKFNQRLHHQGTKMYLSEVKRLVLDRLQRIHFAGQITGTIYLSQHQAWHELTKPC